MIWFALLKMRALSCLHEKEGSVWNESAWETLLFGTPVDYLSHVGISEEFYSVDLTPEKFVNLDSMEIGLTDTLPLDPDSCVVFPHTDAGPEELFSVGIQSGNNEGKVSIAGVFEDSVGNSIEGLGGPLDAVTKGASTTLQELIPLNSSEGIPVTAHITTDTQHPDAILVTFDEPLAQPLASIEIDGELYALESYTGPPESQPNHSSCYNTKGLAPNHEAGESGVPRSPRLNKGARLNPYVRLQRIPELDAHIPGKDIFVIDSLCKPKYGRVHGDMIPPCQGKKSYSKRARTPKYQKLAKKVRKNQEYRLITNSISAGKVINENKVPLGIEKMTWEEKSRFRDLMEVDLEITLPIIDQLQNHVITLISGNRLDSSDNTLLKGAILKFFDKAGFKNVDLFSKGVYDQCLIGKDQDFVDLRDRVTDIPELFGIFTNISLKYFFHDLNWFLRERVTIVKLFIIAVFKAAIHGHPMTNEFKGTFRRCLAVCLSGFPRINASKQPYENYVVFCDYLDKLANGPSAELYNRYEYILGPLVFMASTQRLFSRIAAKIESGTPVPGNVLVLYNIATGRPTVSNLSALETLDIILGAAKKHYGENPHAGSHLMHLVRAFFSGNSNVRWKNHTNTVRTAYIMLSSIVTVDNLKDMGGAPDWFHNYITLDNFILFLETLKKHICNVDSKTSIDSYQKVKP